MIVGIKRTALYSEHRHVLIGTERFVIIFRVPYLYGTPYLSCFYSCKRENWLGDCDTLKGSENNANLYTILM